jgi:hypothetical protein
VRGDRHVYEHGIRRSGPRLAGPGLSAAIRLVVLVARPGRALRSRSWSAPDLAGLHDYVGALGPAAPGVFVLLYAAATLAPLPKNVMSAVAGLIFGLAAGIGVVLVAATLRASIALVLGRARPRRSRAVHRDPARAGRPAAAPPRDPRPHRAPAVPRGAQLRVFDGCGAGLGQGIDEAD